MATFRLKALNERAEDDALRESAEDGAIVEGVIPERPMLCVAVAKLESDAAEDEREQHDQDRKVDRGQDDREGERESRQKRDPAEHEPGLVAVPDRRDRVHDQIARIPIGREAIEDADAQIEAVQKHIEKDADSKHERPDRHEIENERAHNRPPGPVAGSAWTGPAGRPLSIGSGSAAASPGPRRTSLTISAKPAENMTRYTRQ